MQVNLPVLIEIPVSYSIKILEDAVITFLQIYFHISLQINLRGLTEAKNDGSLGCAFGELNPFHHFLRNIWMKYCYF